MYCVRAIIVESSSSSFALVRPNSNNQQIHLPTTGEPFFANIIPCYSAIWRQWGAQRMEALGTSAAASSSGTANAFHPPPSNLSEIFVALSGIFPLHGSWPQIRTRLRILWMQAILIEHQPTRQKLNTARDVTCCERHQQRSLHHVKRVVTKNMVT